MEAKTTSQKPAFNNENFDCRNSVPKTIATGTLCITIPINNICIKFSKIVIPQIVANGLCMVSCVVKQLN